MSETPEINGSSIEEIDTTEWEDCEGGHKIPPWPTCAFCGQRHRPAPARLFRASHKVETPGHPVGYTLRSTDAVVLAETRWREAGERSAIYMMANVGSDWLYWRSVPD